MTERDEERIDLSALGKADPRQTDSVVAAAMVRVLATAPQREPLLADLATWWRPGLVAAAAVVLLALGLVLTRQGRLAESGAPTSLESRVLEWAESGHVPTNGELLATFQGYSR
jgi:hypothetical protein